MGEDTAIRSRSIIDQRLASALDDAERRLLGLDPKTPVAIACQRCLNLARTHAQGKKFFAAWDNLHQFDDEYLAALDEEKRKTVWIDLIAEAEAKLTKWRLQAVMTLNKVTEKDSDFVPSVSNLQCVRRHLAAQAQNQQMKSALINQRVPFVLILSVIIMGSFLVAAMLGVFDGLNPELRQTIPITALCGLLGAMASITLTIRALDLGRVVPEFKERWPAPLLRLVLGPLCALPVVFLISAGALKIGGMSTAWMAAVFGLAAGFSERWFMTVIEGLLSKANKDE